MNVRALQENPLARDTFSDYLRMLGVKNTESYLKFNTVEDDLNYDNIELAVETIKRYKDREITIIGDP